MEISKDLSNGILEAIINNLNHDALFYSVIAVCLIIGALFFCLYMIVEEGIFHPLVWLLIPTIIVVILLTYNHPFIDEEQLVADSYKIELKSIYRTSLKCKSSGSSENTNTEINELKDAKVDKSGHIAFKPHGLGTGYRYIVPKTKAYDPVVLPSEVNQFTEEHSNKDLPIYVAVYSVDISGKLDLTNKALEVLRNASKNFKLIIGVNEQFIYPAEDVYYKGMDTPDLVIEEKPEDEIPPNETADVERKERLEFTNQLTGQIINSNWGKSYILILKDGSAFPIDFTDEIKFFSDNSNYIIKCNGKVKEVHYKEEEEKGAVNVNVDNDITIDTENKK